MPNDISECFSGSDHLPTSFLLDADTQALIDAAQRLRGTRIVCIGDVMLDHYIYGRVERISPEAPVPVLRVSEEKRMLGGAGNVVSNLAALGAEVTFLSAVGADESGRELLRIVGGMPALDVHLLAEADRRTTVKTRYIAGAQHLIRADRESTAPMSETTRTDLLRLAGDVVSRSAAIVLSDYGKGLLSNGVAQHIIQLARAASRPIIVDPKGADYGPYSGATLLKPNRFELAVATGLAVETDAEITAAATWLIETYDLGAVLTSLSEHGMMLVTRDGLTLRLRAQAAELFDVSGAGDTVVAAVAAAVGAGLDLVVGARLANTAAGVAVEKVGTAAVSTEELVAALAGGRGTLRKLAPLSRAVEIVDGWRARGLKVGLADGCFDLLHPGHAYMLAEARAACDRLVVALNDDASAARLRAESRPTRPEQDRAAVLGAMGCVDLVTIFGDEAARSLVAAMRPDVLVKTANDRTDELPGAEIVQSYGGRILTIPVLPGYGPLNEAVQTA